MKYPSWNKKPYGECDLERLHSLESLVGTRLPVDLVGWLRDVNGGEPKYKCIEISKDWGISEINNIYGLNEGPDHKQIDKCNSWLKDNLKDGLLAFADDPGGNQFTVCLRESGFGQIFFWDHETGDVFQIANNIQIFINELFECDWEISILEKILRKDDVESLKTWISKRSIEVRNDVGNTPLEEASVYSSLKCIKYLHSQGAELGKSLEIANSNLKYFPDHKLTVDLLKGLYS